MTQSKPFIPMVSCMGHMETHCRTKVTMPCLRVWGMKYKTVLLSAFAYMVHMEFRLKTGLKADPD